MKSVNLYPALAAWRQRDGNKPTSQWTYDDLWRAAMAEFEARDNTENPQREQQYQREAIAVLLDEQLHKVKLNSTWARRFVARLSELKDSKSA